jgi:hypothetical protein
MRDVIIMRAVHVAAVVIWIGGVSMVTTVLLPALRRGQFGDNPAVGRRWRKSDCCSRSSPDTWPAWPLFKVQVNVPELSTSVFVIPRDCVKSGPGRCVVPNQPRHYECYQDLQNQRVRFGKQPETGPQKRGRRYKGHRVPLAPFSFGTSD